jgi:hypothetical protein
VKRTVKLVASHPRRARKSGMMEEVHQQKR